MKNEKNKEFLTVSELARLLGISRTAVFKKIKAGLINAKKFKNKYLIPADEVLKIQGKVLTAQQKRLIELAVKKVMKEYGDVILKLGSE
jgi:excisionase family DNA binding protein